MSDCYCYTWSCPDTGVVKYVGAGRGPRAYSFSDRLCGASAWVDGLRKQGKRPVVTIVASDLSRESAGEKERALIAKYGRQGFDVDGVLFNRGLGGKGNIGKPSDAAYVSTKPIDASRSPLLQIREASPGLLQICDDWSLLQIHKATS